MYLLLREVKFEVESGALITLRFGFDTVIDKRWVHFSCYDGKTDSITTELIQGTRPLSIEAKLIFHRKIMDACKTTPANDEELSDIKKVVNLCVFGDA